MFRRILLFTLIVCVLCLFLIQQVSYADIPDLVRQHETSIANTIGLMNTTIGNYNTLKGAMDTLNSDFKTNQKAVRKGVEVTVTIAAGAIISATASVISGGTLAPAAFAGYIALRTAAGTAKTAWKSAELISAMGTTLSAMDGALSDVNKAYSGDGRDDDNSDNIVSIQLLIDGSLVTRETIGYKPRYKKYLTECAKHINQSYDWLNTEVNTNGREQVDSHTYLFKLYYKHWPSAPPSGYQGNTWNTIALPDKYECEGPCTDMFRSAHEAWSSHRRKCGLESTKHSTDAYVLEGRSLEEGCGKVWYSCDNNADTDANIDTEAANHQIKWCVKDFIDSDGVKYNSCGRRFRKCMKKVFDHNLSDLLPALFSKHSDVEDSSDDDQETDGYVAPSPTPTPSYHTCGTHVTTVSGNHESAGCGTTGHYQCDSKTHTAAVCGTSGHYKCDGKDHSMQVSCTIHTKDGQSCTVINFYACQSHTPVYPAPSTTCANGHTYDPSKANQVNEHRTRTCRFCGQTWEVCGSGRPSVCNDPKRKRQGKGCWAEDI